MNPLRLALRTLLLGQPRARLAMLLIAASLCVLDLSAGRLASERSRFEYQAVVGERLGHLALLARGGRGFTRGEAQQVRHIAEQVPGIVLVTPPGGIDGAAGVRSLEAFLADPSTLETRKRALAAALQRAGANAEVLGWRELSTAYAEEDRAASAEFSCVAIAVLALVGAAVGVTVSIGTLERRRELATLRALGMPCRNVFALMAAEVGWMVGIGSAASLAMSGLVAWIANRAALSFATQAALSRPALMVELDPERVAAALLAVLAAAMLAAFIPAFKAARADVACGLSLSGRAGW